METIDRELLRRYAQDYEIHLDDKMLTQFEQHYEILSDWNQRINLTAITDPQDVIVKHYIDSLILPMQVEIKTGAKMIDVGTGAGFPSIPIKILREDIKLTMLDSLNKRVQFLKILTEGLNIQAQAVHARAEEAARQKAFREQYDIATARAVAHLRELSEYCLPFVRVGGCFVAMKGFEIEQEISQARTAIRLLGGRLEAVKKVSLPDGSKRSLVIIQKISATTPEYPRPSAKIAKKPLE